MLRPRFSLLSLLLLSLACAAGMGVYWRSPAWVVELEISNASDDDIHSAVVSPDGQYIIVPVRPNELVCYSRDGRILWGPVLAMTLEVKFSSNSRWLFVTNTSPKYTTIYDLKTGRVEQTVATSYISDTFSISPNGKHLIHANDGLAIWRMINGRKITALENQPSPCFPSEEYLRRLRSAHAIARKEVPKAWDLVSYCEILRGPQQSNFPGDIEFESKAALDQDDPDSHAAERPFSYPLAMGASACVSSDGSRILTSVHMSDDSSDKPVFKTAATLWSGDTLDRLSDFQIPDNFYIHTLSRDGGSAMLLGWGNGELRIISVPEGRILFQTQGLQGWSHLDDYTGFSADGVHVYESFSRTLKDTDKTEYLTRLSRLSDGHLINEVPDIFRPSETLPDMRRALKDSTSIGDLATSAMLFQFQQSNNADSDTCDILALFPDNEHILTNGSNHSLLIWKRVRPEWWWGHFWLWETYVLMAFSLAFFWSLLPRPSPRAKASTSAAVISAV